MKFSEKEYCTGESLGSPCLCRTDRAGTGRYFFRNFLIVFFLLVCTSAVHVQAADKGRPLQQEDFAYGMDLRINENHAIYGLTLPAAVYQGCTGTDLGDLRVFNAEHTVPHLLRTQINKEETERPAQSLPFFPLFNERQSRSHSSPDLHIAIDSQGTIIDIRQNVLEGSDQIITAYILDTSVLEQPADWLEFTWEGEDEQFSTSIRLDSSIDLNSWQTRVGSSTLAELRFGGHTLLRNRISVPQGLPQKGYLRLSWPAGKNDVSLTDVKAGYNRETQAHPRTVLSLTGEALPMIEQGALRYQYDSKGFFPVDQLNIRLPEQNSLSRIAVFSRASAESSWKRRASFLAYSLTLNGQNLNSGITNINRTTDRYWRLELEADSGIYEPPVLELGWLPGQLLFLAQGKKPYTLAYGKSGLKEAQYQMDQLLKAVDPLNGTQLLAQAQSGPEKILGGREKLEPVRELPWRNWLLWTVLIVGVMVAGTMALKLYREMNGQQASQDD